MIKAFRIKDNNDICLPVFCSHLIWQGSQNPVKLSLDCFRDSLDLSHVGS